MEMNLATLICIKSGRSLLFTRGKGYAVRIVQSITGACFVLHSLKPSFKGLESEKVLMSLEKEALWRIKMVFSILRTRAAGTITTNQVVTSGIFPFLSTVLCV
jgi:hypothetical protein